MSSFVENAASKRSPSATDEKKAAFDFRDRLATADKDGKRRWIYPKKVTGRWYRRRTYFSWLLLALMFTGPFVKINGNPLLLMNIVERKFSILGQIFWPQDTIIFAVAMLLFLMGIIAFTTVFGRLWCGWACPQTVLMEMVFRKIEYLIEGDAAAQRRLTMEKWSGRKLLKKATKQGIFFGLSLLIANCLLSYIIGLESLIGIVTDDPRRHITGLSFMLLFTAIFYLIFARFREQACTFICPYGRFQSAIQDENTMIVAYDYRRGENRGPLQRTRALIERSKAGFGDCVDCRQCVSVCPTGIDIRNGTQMECVNCTACIDACDAVMTKIGRPTGLIRYASLNSIEKGERLRFTPRMFLYSTVLTALTVLFFFLLFTRSDVQAMFLRAPGGLYQETADGKVSNLYTLKLVNKTSRDIPVELKLENSTGAIEMMGAGVLTVPKADMAQTSVLIKLERGLLKGANTRLKIGVYSNNKRLELIDTVFIGPRS